MMRRSLLQPVLAVRTPVPAAPVTVTASPGP